MSYYINFNKVRPAGSIHCYVSTSDKRLFVFESFFCRDIQFYPISIDDEYFSKWLKDSKKTQSKMTGNSCCLSDLGDKVVIEDMFLDVPSNIIMSKDELIYAIEQWVAFCNDFQERFIELKSLEFPASLRCATN